MSVTSETSSQSSTGTPTGTSTENVPQSWVTVCPLARLPVERGVAALVNGEPVAVFRMRTGELYAVDHREPFNGVPVIARGLVGSVGDTPVVISPLYKQRFDLRTGVCLDDPDSPLRTWPVRVTDDQVQVQAQIEVQEEF